MNKLKIAQFLCKYKYTFILTIYFILISFVPINFSIRIYGVINITLMIGLNLLLSRFKWYFTLIPNIVLIFFICLSSFFSLILHSRVWTDPLLNILRTNTDEAQGMIANFLFEGLLIIAISIFLFLKSQNELKQIKPKIAYSLGLISLLYALVYFPIKVNNHLLKENLSIMTHPFEASNYATLRAPIFMGNIFALYNCYRELETMKELVSKSKYKQLPEGIEDTGNNTDFQQIIIVIGESAARNNCSLYGYERNTTPNLDSLYRENKLLMHNNCITSHPATLIAVKRALSFAAVNCDSMAYTHKSLAELGNDKDFETIWISSQIETGAELSIMPLHMNAQRSYFINVNGMKKIPDMELIPIFEKEFNPAKKQLIFIHLNGSHIKYKDRYDQADLMAILGEKEKKNIDTMDEYDSSIHYTDRFLKKIYNIINTSPSSTLFYFSDHGEIIGKGHGYDYKFKEQFEIPFLVLSSNPANLTVVNSIISTYTDPEHERLNTSNFPYIIANILGYSVSDLTRIEALKNSDKVSFPSGEVKIYNTIKNS